MALNQFSRTQLLLGQESMDLLANATVAVFGIGGVGVFVARNATFEGESKVVARLKITIAEPADNE